MTGSRSVRPGTGVALLAVLAGVGACGGGSTATVGDGAPVPAPAAPPRPDREALCQEIYNYYDCSRVVERVQLSNMPGRLDRRGDTLLIALSGGGRIRVVDRDTGGPGTNLFTYSDYLARIGQHLLIVHYWEGAERVLVDDRTGERIRIAARPAVSPDARRIVVASQEGVAGYAPNELQVWRVTADGLELEWELRPDDWGATDARWQGGDTVLFTMTRPCDGAEICGSPASLRTSGDGWVVEEDPER